MDIADKKNTSIQVFVRIRPILKHEQSQEEIIRADNDSKHVIIDSSTSQTIKQQFDAVFDPYLTQKEVYSYFIPGMNQLQQGFNVTVLAYGQTGAGKTHTMFGSDWEYQTNINQNNNEIVFKNQATFIEDLATDINNAGIIPRSIYQIFNNTDQAFIYCSFLQVYNEKVFDLLQEYQKPKPLSIHESKLDGIYVEGLSEYAVNHYYDCLTLMKRGEKNRYIRQTQMNMKSSRSHTIFQILIESSKADSQGKLKKCKLNLCDLAGSEKIQNFSKMNAGHLQELKNINQSLTTLGKVIHSLSQNKKLPIPYRESKLTRLLQDSLGGNTQTYMIANVASNLNNLDETYSTLKFAERAKNVPLVIQANKIIATDQDLLNKLIKEIDYLKNMLNMKRKGINSNDIHFKLMKVQEENERLRKESISVQQVEGLIKENRQMKIELQKMHQVMSVGGGEQDTSMKLQNETSETNDNEFIDRKISDLSESGDILKTQNIPFQTRVIVNDIDYSGYRNRGSSFKNLQNNGIMVVSNSQMTFPKTEVNVRMRGKRNELQNHKGYVEQSQYEYQKNLMLQKERKRVIERLQLLDQVQVKNNMRMIDISSDFGSQKQTLHTAWQSQPRQQKSLEHRQMQQNKRMQDYDLKLKIIEKQLIQL